MDFSPIYQESTGKLYTFAEVHFYDTAEKENHSGYTWEMVETALNEPTNIRQSPTGAMEYRYYVKSENRWLKVVVNEQKELIITVHWYEPDELNGEALKNQENKE